MSSHLNAGYQLMISHRQHSSVQRGRGSWTYSQGHHGIISTMSSLLEPSLEHRQFFFSSIPSTLQLFCRNSDLFAIIFFFPQFSYFAVDRWVKLKKPHLYLNTHFALLSLEASQLRSLFNHNFKTKPEPSKRPWNFEDWPHYPGFPKIITEKGILVQNCRLPTTHKTDVFTCVARVRFACRLIKGQLCNIIKTRCFIIIGLHWGAFHFPAKHPKSRGDLSLSQSTVMFNTRQQRGNLFGLHHQMYPVPFNCK